MREESGPTVGLGRVGLVWVGGLCWLGIWLSAFVGIWLFVVVFGGEELFVIYTVAFLSFFWCVGKKGYLGGVKSFTVRGLLFWVATQFFFQLVVVCLMSLVCFIWI